MRKNTLPLPEAGLIARIIPTTSSKRTVQSLEEQWFMEGMLAIRGFKS